MSTATTPVSPSLPIPPLPENFHGTGSFYSAVLKSTRPPPPSLQPVLPPYAPYSWQPFDGNQVGSPIVCITPSRVWFNTMIPIPPTLPAPIGAPLVPSSMGPISTPSASSSANPLTTMAAMASMATLPSVAQMAPVSPMPQLAPMALGGYSGELPSFAHHDLPPYATKIREESGPRMTVNSISSICHPVTTDDASRITAHSSPSSTASSDPASPLQQATTSKQYTSKPILGSDSYSMNPTQHGLSASEMTRSRFKLKTPPKKVPRRIQSINNFSPKFQEAFAQQLSDYENSQREHSVHSIREGTGSESRYICSKCGLKFLQQKHVSRHASTHFHYKPFKCIWCKMEFSRADSLLRHATRSKCNPENRGMR